MLETLNYEMPRFCHSEGNPEKSDGTSRHPERSEGPNRETLRLTQGDTAVSDSSP